MAKAKALPYEQKLVRALEKFYASCDEIADIALQHDIHQNHVSDVQKLVHARAAELKKQVEQKRPKFDVVLSPVTDEQDDVTSKTSSVRPGASTSGHSLASSGADGVA